MRESSARAPHLRCRRPSVAAPQEAKCARHLSGDVAVAVQSSEWQSARPTEPRGGSSSCRSTGEPPPATGRDLKARLASDRHAIPLRGD